MAEVFADESTVFFVGGTGTKAGDSQCGGCTRAWYDDNFTQLSDIMGTDGAPLIDLTGCSFSFANKRIGKTGSGEFAGIQAGMVAWLDDLGSGGGSTNRYEITAVDSGGDWLEISGWDATGDSSNVTVKIGGAFDSLVNCLGAVTAMSHSVDIFTNKDEVITGTVNDNSGGGDLTKNTHRRVIGFNTVPGDMGKGGSYYQSPIDAYRDGIDADSVVSIDANSGAYSVWIIDGLSNLEFCNLYLHDTNKAGDMNAVRLLNSPAGILFENCRFDSVDKVVNEVCDGVSFIDCFNGADVARQPVVIGQGGLIAGCVWQGATTAGQSVVGMRYDYSSVMLDSIIIGGRYGVRAMGLNVVAGNTFYDQEDACVCIQRSDAILTAYDNIFMPQSGAHGIDIADTTGGAAGYSDYNCFIGINGGVLADPVNSDYAAGESPVMGVHSIEIGPRFVDVAGGDFRVCDGIVLRGGREDVYGVRGFIGAAGREMMFRGRSRVVNRGRVNILR